MFSNLKKWISLKQQADGKSYTGSARTKGYDPINHRYWSQPRDLPPFSFATVYNMLVDPEVRLAVSTRSAPLFGAEFGYKENGQFVEGVQADRPEVAVYVERQLKKIWRNHLHEICAAQVWGWSAGEIVLDLGSSKLIEIDRIESRHAQDCRLILEDGKPCGVQFSRVQNEGKVDIGFPEAFFHSHNSDPGEVYGQSCLMGAYSPWADKWLDGGALDVRRLFMHKDAYGGASLGYPDGETYIDGLSQPIPNRDIARQIVEQIRAGNTIVRPSQRDANGNELWPIERAQVASNPAHILQYPKDLDSEIRTGIGIPDGVLNDDGGGSYAGKRIPMAAFYAGLDIWLVQILNDLTQQIFEPLVLSNFGKAIDFQVDFKPLAEQAMEQQSNSGAGDPGGGLPPGMMPPGQEGQEQMMGGEAGGDIGDDGLGDLFGEDAQMMSSIGNGETSAADIVAAARRTVRLSAEPVDAAPDDDDDDDVLAQAELIAEILAGIFGDDAEDKFDEMFGADETKMSAWNPALHPRGPDGRFIERNSPEAVAAAKKQVSQALAGRRTPAALRKVTENLSILTTKQLRDVKRKYNLRASGVRQSFIDKIANQLMGSVSEDYAEPEDYRQSTPTRGDGTPKEPESQDVYTIPTDSLHVDAKRFQYKVSGIDKQGVTDELKETKKWNPELGGVLLIWRDPENGKDYVINGHHRHELASRLGANELNVRYINASTPLEARAKGALANIAEGRGTALDAAKYMRDIGQGPEHLQRAGVSLSGRVAKAATALRNLSDRSFQALTNGYIDEDTAVIVASHLNDPKLQDQLFKRLEDKEWSQSKIRLAARQMEGASKRTVETSDLFGTYEEDESLWEAETAVADHVGKLLRRKVRDFQSVANKGRASRVAEAGNVLVVEENERLRKEAEALYKKFDRDFVNSYKGGIMDTVKLFGEQYADANNRAQRNTVLAAAFDAMMTLLERQNEPELRIAAEQIPQEMFS